MSESSNIQRPDSKEVRDRFYTTIPLIAAAQLYIFSKATEVIQNEKYSPEAILLAKKIGWWSFVGAGAAAVSYAAFLVVLVLSVISAELRRRSGRTPRNGDSFIAGAFLLVLSIGVPSMLAYTFFCAIRMLELSLLK